MKSGQALPQAISWQGGWLLKAGYSAGFLSLAFKGQVGLLLCSFGLPETRYLNMESVRPVNG
ncbi:MAG: hypothetical protein C0507_12345 [Cyanobacteria bacterium PR.3.49]|nr:hypothetical protein [Cyanobacteria bacterium PR.3.49]